MQKFIKHTLYVFLIITGITVLLTLAGLVYIWFWNPKEDLPYLHWLLTLSISEVVASIIAVFNKGFRYIPEVREDKKMTNTLEFMKNFISQGSSATIVSNRLSWLNDSLIAELCEKIKDGVAIEIITPKQLTMDVQSKLIGATFIVTHEMNAPDARFTLINGGRIGAEKLAIARGVHPNHEITIFDTSSGPQIIAMAKDIIRKSKGLANV